jgi:hypothetical protein
LLPDIVTKSSATINTTNDVTPMFWVLTSSLTFAEQRRRGETHLEEAPVVAFSDKLLITDVLGSSGISPSLESLHQDSRIKSSVPL